MGLMDCNSPFGQSTCDGCHKRGKVQLPKLRVFKYQELSRATKAFAEKNIVGKGSHSCVYKAVLSDGEVVAVKRPTVGRRTLKDAISFDNELDILSKLRHRHLVNLIGFCSESHEKLLVVEFMENGNLYDALHCSKEPLSWSARLNMALQVAKAILALHSSTPPIIHRDVKSSNILIDRYWNAKLSDLGLALRGPLDDEARQKTPPAGTMGYIDPAYETPAHLSSKSDVFSFGILLLEIISGRKAIDVRFDPSSLVDWAGPLIRRGDARAVFDKSLEPPQDPDVVQDLAAIAGRSVRQLRERRPTMTEVVESLRRINKKLPTPLFGDRQLRVPRIALPASNIEDSSSEALSRVDILASSLGKDEAIRKDFDRGAFLPDLQAMSIRDEGKVSKDGNSTSSSESGRSSNSCVYSRRRDSRVADISGSGRVTGKKTIAQQASSSGAVRVATGKPESPIFDPNSAPKMIDSPLRFEMVRNSFVSPISRSSGSSVNTCGVDRNTAAAWRPSETPIFGSKRPERVSRTAAPGLSTLGSDFRLKGIESRASEIAREREPNPEKREISHKAFPERTRGLAVSQRRSKEGREIRLSVTSQPRVQTAAAQMPLAPGSSSQLPSKRSSRDTGVIQLRSSSKPNVQLKSQRHRPKGNRSSEAATRSSRESTEGQQPPSPMRPVRSALQRSLSKRSRRSQVSPRENDLTEAQASSSNTPLHGSGKAGIRAP